MKFILTTLALLLAFHSSKAQNDTIYVPFVAYWSPGDIYEFNVTKVKRQWAGERLVKDDSSNYVARFEVLNETDSSYSIKWSFDNMLLSAFRFPPELIKRMSKYKVSEVIYNTTELGEFIEIKNWEEFSKLMNDLFQEVVDELGETPEVKADINKYLESIRPLLSSKQAIEELMLPEIQHFHLPMGSEYIEDDLWEYEDQIPNILGGSPIRADASIIVTEVDLENETCLLTNKSKLNEEDTKSVLKQFFGRMNLKEDEMDEMLSNAVLDIQDFNTYHFYYNPGVPISIKTQRTVNMVLGSQDLKRVDKIKIQLVN